MAATNFDGPAFVYGDMGYLQSSVTGNAAVPDTNADAGPSMTYQGDGLPDVRFPFLKDKVQGYTGVVAGFMDIIGVQTVDQVPAAAGVATIAAAANAVSGTAMTLVTASAAGITTNIPLVPFGGSLNQLAATIAPVVLDFGFAFGNVAAGNQVITVADSTQFWVGMPLVIGNVGNAAGTAALLTFVVAVPSATTITVNDLPLATNATAAIGTGNLWTQSGPINTIPPTGHLPYLARGPALLQDPAQSIARGVSITGATGATGGVFTVRGWDVFWQPMREDITAGAGNVTTYGRKAFKAIQSVTPQFADAHAYSVGTSDVFGLHTRSDRWEYTNIFWAGAFMTASQGWLAADKTNPATATTGDVRGTVQTSANGSTSGGGIGTNGSNGAITSLQMSGRRLSIFMSIPVYNTIRATPFNPVPMFGSTQYYA